MVWRYLIFPIVHIYTIQPIRTCTTSYMSRPHTPNENFNTSSRQLLIMLSILIVKAVSTEHCIWCTILACLNILIIFYSILLLIAPVSYFMILHLNYILLFIQLEVLQHYELLCTQQLTLHYLRQYLWEYWILRQSTSETIVSY